MKKVILVAAAMLLLAAQVTVAQGARAGVKQEKIGYVDLQQALNMSNEGQTAKVELQAVLKGLQARIDKKIAERDKLKADLERQASVLSPKAVKEKEAALAKLTADTKQLISESNTEMQQKQKAKEVVILQKIKNAIDQIGKSGHYTVILPADVILYSHGAKELTGEVIRKVNQASAAASAPASKPAAK